MAEPTKAELIWNRALNAKAFRMLKGDLALYCMLLVNGYAANGGVFHAAEMDGDDLAEGIEGYRYFGLNEAADILVKVKAIFDADDDWGLLEEKFNKKFYAITEDDLLLKRLEAMVLLKPEEFAPL